MVDLEPKSSSGEGQVGIDGIVPRFAPALNNQ
jgi:hypothetical protein